MEENTTEHMKEILIKKGRVDFNQQQIQLEVLIKIVNRLRDVFFSLIVVIILLLCILFQI
jgi:hypothetical protein